jgi:hypothetical protein
VHEDSDKALRNVIIAPQELFNKEDEAEVEQCDMKIENQLGKFFNVENRAIEAGTENRKGC